MFGLPLPLLGGVLGLIALVATLLFVFRSGKKQAQQERAVEDAKAVNTANDVRKEVASRSEEENRKRLKTWSKS